MDDLRDLLQQIGVTRPDRMTMAQFMAALQEAEAEGTAVDRDLVARLWKLWARTEAVACPEYVSAFVALSLIHI